MSLPLGGEMDTTPMNERDGGPAPVMVQPVDLSRIEGVGGVVWSVSPGGLHANLVVLEAAGAIAAHRNDALDVLVVVLAGAGEATVDDDTFDLVPAVALLVPRGAERSITAGPAGLRYLTVHAQRGPLTISSRGNRHLRSAPLNERASPLAPAPEGSP